MDLQMITPTAVDWDGDGDLDLIVGDEDGRVALVENAGTLGADRAPQFLPPRYFQQEADDLKFGALATPVGFDWDSDGDYDILSGDTAGYIGFFENLSGPGVEQPKWASPKLLEADGAVIRIMAGPNGSIQGPCEAKWGYTTLSVADWDADGRPDLLVNSIWGKVHWYRNVGSRKPPKLAAARPIEVEWDKNDPQPSLAWGWLRPEGKKLLTQWRTTPFAVDWNNNGLVDLVMLDHEGYLALYPRAKRRPDGAVPPLAGVRRRDRRADATQRGQGRQERPSQALRRRLGRRRQARPAAQRRQRPAAAANRPRRPGLGVPRSGPVVRSKHRRPRRQPHRRRLQRRRSPRLPRRRRGRPVLLPPQPRDQTDAGESEIARRSPVHLSRAVHELGTSRPRFSASNWRSQSLRSRPPP